METVTMKSGYLHSSHSQPLCGGDNVAHGANEYFCFHWAEKIVLE